MANIRSDSLYVSNLSYNSDSESLKGAFPGCIQADVIMDRSTEKSKGYGFVRFPSNVEAQAILDQVGGPGGTRNIDGRDVKINYAHNKEDRSGGGQQYQSRGGGGGRGRGGGGRGGYGNQGGYGNNDYNSSWGGQSQGYNQDGGYGQNYGAQQQQQQGGYGGQQAGYVAGQQQAGYAAGQQQGGYGYNAQQYTAQSADTSSYNQAQGQQGWQQPQQGQQSWQQPQQQPQQQGWTQGQTGQYGDGDYQQQSGGGYAAANQAAPRGGNWGTYQQQ